MKLSLSDMFALFFRKPPPRPNGVCPICGEPFAVEQSRMGLAISRQREIPVCPKSKCELTAECRNDKKFPIRERGYR